MKPFADSSLKFAYLFETAYYLLTGTCILNWIVGTRKLKVA